MIKNTLLTVIALTLSVSSVVAGGEGWINDFEAAKKKASAEKKDILVNLGVIFSDVFMLRLAAKIEASGCLPA